MACRSRLDAGDALVEIIIDDAHAGGEVQRRDAPLLRLAGLGGREAGASERPLGGRNSIVGKFPSPRILDLSWGRLEVAGCGAFKDAKLYPGGAREWDWRETGTRHVPGIQPTDVTELLEHGAEVVVLSSGVLERLQVCPETLNLLKNKGIPAHVLPTEEAVRLYNELAAQQKVGGLFHSTC